MSGLPRVGSGSGSGAAQEDEFDFSSAPTLSGMQPDSQPDRRLPPPELGSPYARGSLADSLYSGHLQPHGGPPLRSYTTSASPSMAPLLPASPPHGAYSLAGGGVLAGGSGLEGGGCGATAAGGAGAGSRQVLPFEQAARTSPLPAPAAALSPFQPHAWLGGPAASSWELPAVAAQPAAPAAAPPPQAAAAQLAASGSGISDDDVTQLPAAAAKLAPAGDSAAEPAATPRAAALAAASADPGTNESAGAGGSAAGVAAATTPGAGSARVTSPGARFAARVAAAAARFPFGSRAKGEGKPYGVHETPTKRVAVLTEWGFPEPEETVERDGYSGMPQYCPGCGVHVLPQAAIAYSHQRGNKSGSNPDGEQALALHMSCPDMCTQQRASPSQPPLVHCRACAPPAYSLMPLALLCLACTFCCTADPRNDQELQRLAASCDSRVMAKRVRAWGPAAALQPGQMQGSMSPTPSHSGRRPTCKRASRRRCIAGMLSWGEQPIQPVLPPFSLERRCPAGTMLIAAQASCAMTSKPRRQPTDRARSAAGPGNVARMRFDLHVGQHGWPSLPLFIPDWQCRKRRETEAEAEA